VCWCVCASWGWFLGTVGVEVKASNNRMRTRINAIQSTPDDHPQQVAGTTIKGETETANIIAGDIQAGQVGGCGWIEAAG